MRNHLGLLLSFALGLAATGAKAAPSDIALPDDRAYPESITSTADGTLYVGSIAAGGVVRIKAGSSQPESWIKPAAFDTRSTFGVLADERSQTLWVCSNDISALGVQGPSAVRGSALKGFDLKSGAGKVSAALPGERALCNDMAVGPDGSVYVTNSLAPQILRLKPGAHELEVWASDPGFVPPAQGAGLDGILFGADGALYVDTFNKAELFRVEVTDGRAGKVTRLQTSRPLVLSDALRAAEGKSFLMIEGEGRLDRVTVEGDTAKIETLRTASGNRRA